MVQKGRTNEGVRFRNWNVGIYVGRKYMQLEDMEDLDGIIKRILENKESQKGQGDDNKVIRMREP